MSIAIRAKRVEGTPTAEPRLRRPRIAVLYHYFPPDDVVSARHYGDLCAGLAERGWDVTAMPCNRGCHDSSRSFPLCDRVSTQGASYPLISVGAGTASVLPVSPGAERRGGPSIRSSTARLSCQL